MPLDPQAKAHLELLASLNTPPMHTLPPEVTRANMEKAPRPPGPEVAKVEAHLIQGIGGDIPVRMYTPRGSGPFPALVWFHGGGWVFGSVDMADSTARHLANMATCVVLSVDYRLAPETKFPGAAEDCYSATKWTADNVASINVDPSKIAVGGDSAGGNLAAVVPIMALDRGGPSIIHQLLVYPVIDRNFSTSSYEKNAAGYLLSREMMVWFWDQYLGDDADATNPYVAPLNLDTHANLPPATVITAEYDPLRDEGASYAQCLKEAGVRVKHFDYSGMIHGFFGLWWVMDTARDAQVAAANELLSSFST